MLHGDCRITKASPLKFLRSFLEEYSPKVENKWVVLDQGGELFKNPQIINLFREFHYTIMPTGADASRQNAPVERAHRTIGTAIKSVLVRAGLDIKFLSLIHI